VIESRRKRSTWLTVLVGGVVLLMLVAVLWPVTTGGPLRAKSAACMSNLKQLAIAEIMYASDYGDQLPDAMAWMDEINPYVKNEDCFRCPGIEGKDKGVFGYAMDLTMSGKLTEKVAKPESTVLLFDSVLLARNACSGFYGLPNPPRHNKKNIVAFLDGHVKGLVPKGGER
jgi:prepilin-type processing-associated H-X9-DG protein